MPSPLLALFSTPHTRPNIELLTNATLINQRNIEWLAETVQGFNVSMEAANSEIHDSIRGKGSFQKTVTALKLLIKNNAEVAVRMTYFDQEENEPENLMRFINDIGVKMFNFRYLVPVGRAANKEIDANQYRRLCEKAWEVGENLDTTVGFSDPFPEILVNMKRQKEINMDTDLLRGISVTGCSIAFALLYINPQGIVQLCPYLPIFVADAKKDDLRKIWFENDLLELFRYSRSLLKGKCGDCEYKFCMRWMQGISFRQGQFFGRRASLLENVVITLTQFWRKAAL